MISHIVKRTELLAPGCWLKSIVLICALMISNTSLLAADIEVIEGQPDVVDASKSQRDPDYRPPTTVYRSGDSSDILGGGRPSDTQTELLLQLQALQTEVMELRGLVEQQAHQLEQLQQRRLDDYVDLDRRISELAGQPLSPITTMNAPTEFVNEVVGSSTAKQRAVSSISSKKKVVSTATNTGGNKANSAITVNENSTTIKVGDDEKGRDAYKAAYNKVKDRKFGDAKIAMVAFVGDYPGHRYVPNAYFWLGELHYHDSDLNQSKDAFSVLIDKYPEHRKVADAKFKLAKILHQQGDAKQAKALLESVINDHGSSRVAKPARDYLDNSLK